jgi:nitrate/nitrite transporter NarK
VLYIGTFGSFIGYATAMPLLIHSQFTEVSATRYAFLGALVASLSRPLGGWLSDRFGGARITLGSFVVLGCGVALVGLALALRSFPAFLATFLVRFLSSGIGNGSTYRMIPAIFRAKALADVAAGGVAGYQAAAVSRGGDKNRLGGRRIRRVFHQPWLRYVRRCDPGARHCARRLRRLLCPVLGPDLVVLPAQADGRSTGP